MLQYKISKYSNLIHKRKTSETKVQMYNQNNATKQQQNHTMRMCSLLHFCYHCSCDAMVDCGNIQNHGANVQPKQCNKTTTKSYNENVFITSLLLSVFMPCDGDCGHPFKDARSEVMNTFSLPLLKEATTNQYFCHRILNFTSNNQQYFILNY